MSDWNASNYRRRKAERLAQSTPEWVTNPETGEKFCLRRVGAMAPMVAGFIPHDLTAEAVQAWEGKVEVGELTEQKQTVDQGQRDLQLIGRVVGQACVVPKLVNGATGENENELDPAELDDKDLMFIFRWATGQAGVPMKGGEVMSRNDLSNFRKRPGRRIRTGDNSGEVRQSA